MYTNINKITYFLYSTIVYFIYILTANITPPMLFWIVNKLLYVCIIALLTLIIYKNKGVIKKYSFTPLVLMFFFFIFSSISYFLNLSFEQAINKSLFQSLIYILFFYFSLTLVENYTISKTLKPFVISSVVLIVLSIFVYFGFKPTFYSATESQLNSYLDMKSGSKLIGFSGIYLNQNTLGYYLIIAISSLSVILIYENHSKIKKTILYIFLILATILILLTSSRGSIVAFIVITLLYILRNYRSKISFYITLSISLLVTFTYIYFYEYINLLLNRFDNDGTSSRTEIWLDALGSFSSNPLWGVGEYTYSTGGGLKLSSHNMYIDQIASNGILPSLFFFFWILYGLKFSLRAFVIRRNITKTDILIAATIIGLLVHQTVETLLRIPLSIFTLFFIMNYSYIIKKGQS